jgi:1-acyl-sn-glycerol-3-phosphate acyltransferase
MLTSPAMWQPTRDALRQLDRRQAWARRVAPALLAPRARVHVEVHGPVPDGPLVVVANHATVLDPLLAGIAVPRAIVWVGTRTLLDGPLAPVVGGLGMVAKSRFAADVPALRQVLRWLDAGAAVGVFPEGERTWDGRLAPFVPGLDKLIARRRLPVLPVRIWNGYRMWPRWSGGLRQGAFAVEVLPVWSPPEGSTSAAVAAHLAALLDVDPRGRPELPARTRARARGLSNLVFACASCGSSSMVEAVDAVGCARCGARWRVDALHMLHGPDGEVPLEVHAAALRERALATLPDHGEVLGVDGVTLTGHGPGDRAPLAHGRLSLRRDHLAVGALRLDLADIHNVNVEYQRTLEIRAGAQYLKATIPTGSAWRWPWTIRSVQGL